MSEHNTAHDAHATHHHVSPTSLYWVVWGALMVFTVITVLAYYIPDWLHVDLGAANVIIAMAIATTKASLVCLYFMHLKYDKKFLSIAFLSSLIFLGLFLGFTLLDINTREDSPSFAKPLYTGRTMPTGEGHAGATSTAPGASSATGHPMEAAPSPGVSPTARQVQGEAQHGNPPATPAPGSKH
jgi:cytochrome c oxidase subunit IV